MSSALIQLRGSKPKTEKTVTSSVKLSYLGVGVDAGRTVHPGKIPQMQAANELNEIVSALLEVAADRKNESIVVVIDEFDRITNDEERSQFADLIKQVGDQRVSIKFVFCGVAESMQKLLGAHGSCYRYLDGVELQTLNYDARFEIIDNVAAALGVSVDDRPRYESLQLVMDSHITSTVCVNSSSGRCFAIRCHARYPQWTTIELLSCNLSSASNST